jgi:hypothetical protein
MCGWMFLCKRKGANERLQLRLIPTALLPRAPGFDGAPLASLSEGRRWWRWMEESVSKR